MIKYELVIFDDETHEVMERMVTADFDNLNVAKRHQDERDEKNKV